MPALWFQLLGPGPAPLSCWVTAGGRSRLATAAQRREACSHGPRRPMGTDGRQASSQAGSGLHSWLWG